MASFSLFSPESTLYGCFVTQHGLGPIGVARLLERFVTPEGVYAASPAQWKAAHPHLSAAMSASLARGPRPEQWEKLIADCETLRIGVTAPAWPGYPAPLCDLDAPPPLLYVRGAIRPEDSRAVALVGTRTPTAYGREAAFGIARELAERGHAIISGLALGIDAAAHAGAMAGEGRTIAVIGCGLDLPYPVENLGVRRKIEERGAVFSEFPPGTPALPAHFPRRNRLVSGLARAVVVVEAGGRSGALITAAHARNQRKPLFAVPGPIFSSVSAGSNALLRKGALLAASAADIAQALGPARAGHVAPGGEESRQPAARRRTRSGEPAPSLDPAPPPRARPHRPDDPVLRLWGDDAVCAMDTLAARAGERGLWPSGRVPAALLESLLQLELRGLVRRLPGAAYELRA